MKTDVISISEFSTIGVYTLLLHVSKEVTLTVGKLEKQMFSEGYYTYTGSALGNGATSLKHRLSRHLKKQKQKFWHIDYLLANQNVSIEAAITAKTKKKMECAINSYLKDLNGAKVPINRFGA
ncbi:GIY-YIG nuclease family protein [Candidatus Bathyarchaeota archaeon]|nr:GIY-YIG nuclease family protein [Candidatus Bathyarchaeota archaeon]